MPKFEKGGKVRVRLDNASSYRGRIGIIDEGPDGDSFGVWYMVKFESQGSSLKYRFADKDLEAIK